MTRTAFFFLAGALALACSPPPDARSSHDAQAVEEGGRREPETEQERRLLAAVAELKAHESASVGGARIEAGPRYAAASGATCREVSLSGAPELADVSLACEDAEGWFFVPALAGSMSAPGVGGAAP